jgi:hypothetical protein
MGDVTTVDFAFVDSFCSAIWFSPRHVNKFQVVPALLVIE